MDNYRMVASLSLEDFSLVPWDEWSFEMNAVAEYASGLADGLLGVVLVCEFERDSDEASGALVERPLFPGKPLPMLLIGEHWHKDGLHGTHQVMPLDYLVLRTLALYLSKTSPATEAEAAAWLAARLRLVMKGDTAWLTALEDSLAEAA